MNDNVLLPWSGRTCQEGMMSKRISSLQARSGVVTGRVCWRYRLSAPSSLLRLTGLAPFISCRPLRQAQQSSHRRPRL